MLWALSYMLVAEHIEKAHIFSKDLMLHIFKRIDATGKVETKFQLFSR